MNMEMGLLDNEKKEKILDAAGPEFLQRLDVNDRLRTYLVKAGVINHLDSQDIETEKPSEQRNSILKRLYSASILQFIHFSLVLHDYCNQPDIVGNVFNLDIEQLRAQKDQIDAEEGTPKDQFPPTRQPGNGDQIDAERGAAKDQFPPKKRPRYGEMATSRAPLSPWDRQNPREAEYMDTSQYRKNLNKSRVILRDKLQVADLWPHLRQMGVITSHDEERMRMGATRCESVDRLIAFLMKSQTWRYHAVLRAMALTQQAHLIPQGGLDLAVYTVDMEPGIVSGIEQDNANSANKEMATCGAPLPPWDRQNPQEAKFVDKSCYLDILNKSRLLLRDNLQVADLWPHLRQMGVITSHDEERMKLGATRSESVDRLIAFVEISQTWCYHAVLRAMALTQQAHLIPQGGLDPAVYTVDMEPGIVSGIEQDKANSANKVPPQPANPQQCSELRGRPITVPDSAGMYHAPQQQPTQVHHYYHYQQQPRDKTKMTVGFKLTGENENIKKSIEEDLRMELFGNNITKAIQASFGVGAPNMIVKYTNPRKRFVSVEIDDNGVGQGMLTEALHGAKVQSRVEAGKEYTIMRDSVVFMDVVGAAIASEIYTQQHVTDHPVDKRIDLDCEYVRLRLLDVKNMRVTKTDDIKMNTDKDRPDYYQLYLEKCGGTDIQEEDLVTDEDIGKCTLLRGRAGIGKSTTVHQLCWKWAHGEWGKRFKAVFLLNIRHFLHIRTKIDFWKLVNMYSVYAPGNMDEAWLKDNEEHLCVVVDGIDEVWKFKDKFHEGSRDDVNSQRTGLEWCFCLLQRKRLGLATLIVSSRPFDDLSVVKPSKLVELMGLTSSLVMKFADCNVTTERVEYVKKTLRDNPILLSVSAVTYYCAALCRILEATDLGTKDFKTYTQINSYIIEDYMKRCLKASEGLPVDINPSLRAISRLAYSGLVRTGPNDLTRLVFSKREYEDHGISDADINLMTRAGIFSQSILEDKENLGGLNMGQFVHLSIQEFLAMAGYLLQDNLDIGKAVSEVSEDDSDGGDAISNTSIDDSDGRDAISQMFESGQFVMAQLYLFGLVFNHQHTSVEAVMARLGLNKDKMTLMQEALRKNLMRSDDELIAMQCINEGQCEQTAQLYAERCLGPGVGYSSTPLTAIDMNALEFTLTHHLTSLNELSLRRVNIDVTSVQTVVHIVNKCQTLKSLTLDDKTIDDDCLHVLSQQWQNSTLKWLTLGHGPISDMGLTAIQDVQRKATGLKSLRLHYYDVTDLGVQQYLPVVVHNPLLTFLQIWSDSVTDVGLQHVAHLVSTSTHLEDVWLWISSIQKEGVDAIMDAMDKNHTIRVRLRLKELCELHLIQRLRTCDRLHVGQW